TSVGSAPDRPVAGSGSGACTGPKRIEGPGGGPQQPAGWAVGRRQVAGGTVVDVGQGPEAVGAVVDLVDADVQHRVGLEEERAVAAEARPSIGAPVENAAERRRTGVTVLTVAGPGHEGRWRRHADLDRGRRGPVQCLAAELAPGLDRRDVGPRL